MSSKISFKSNQEGGGSIMEVPGGHWRFLTGYLDDRVIFDVIDYLVWPKGRYPESFVSISSLEVCQECGVLHGSAWRRLMVLERIIGWQGNLWCHGLQCLTPKKIPWKFRVNIFIRSVSRMGGSFMGVLGGHWGFLTGDVDDRVVHDVMD